MHKKFEINWTKVKGGCQSGRKVVTHNFKSDLPLVSTKMPCTHTSQLELDQFTICSDLETKREEYKV